MTRTIPWLASVLLTVSLFAKDDSAPASKEASRVMRQALTEAVSVDVYEGLPHQMFESELLATESKREDTVKMNSFRFYTPAVAAINHEGLKHLLSSSDTIQVFLGEKLCGGFHPDYAVEWSDKNGSRFSALICLGCHEIIYSDGKNEYRYDLEDAPYLKLSKELMPYTKKRPRVND